MSEKTKFGSWKLKEWSLYYNKSLFETIIICFDDWEPEDYNPDPWEGD